MSRRGLGAAGCACLLCACSFAPRYEVPRTDVATTYKEVGNWQPASPADSLPRGAWWKIYADPVLDGLEAQVDPGNPDLAAAVAAFEHARGFAEEAAAGLFPHAEVNGQLTADKQSADRPLRGGGEPTYYGSNFFGGQAGYELDLWGRVRNTVAAGRDLAQASAAELENVRLMLHAELAQDYVALRGLDRETRLLDDTVAAYQRGLELTQNLYQGKIGSLMDVTRAQAQLESAQADASDVTIERALLEHAIAILIGKPPAAFSLPAGAAPVNAPVEPTGVPAALMQRRPDIAAAERRVAAANSMIGVARAAFFPQLSLTGAAGYQGTTIGLLQTPDRFWSIGPAMTLPLFEGGLLRARERQALATFDEAAGHYRATVLQAIREVEDDLAQLRLLEREASQEQAAAHSAQQTLDMAMGLYQNGATSYLDVVIAQTAALQAQRRVLALDTRRLQASIGLVRALGGGWSADLLQAKSGPAGS